MQNAAVPVVVDLHGRIDAHRCGKCRHSTIIRRSRYRRVLKQSQVVADSLDIEHLPAREPQRRRAFAVLVLERQDAHAHQIAPVNPFVTLGDHGPHPLQRRPLGGPVP